MCYNREMRSSVDSKTRNPVVRVICVCAFAIAVGFPARAQKILVIHSYNTSFPWTTAFEESLREEADIPDSGLELYIENLDVTRFGSVSELEALARFITAKYKNVPIDAVIGNSDHACVFIDEYLRFPPSVPRAYYTTGYENQKPWIFGIAAKYDRNIRDTWSLVGDIFPLMDNVIVISGDPYSTRSVYSHIVELAKKSGIPVRLLEDFTFDELKAEIARVPPTTAVFITPVLKDKTGASSTPKRLLSELAELSPAPIFTFWETMTGSGTVGGYVISARTSAKEMVHAIRDYLSTGSFKNEYTVSKCVIDRIAMERYGLRSDRIPEDATVINWPEPLYVRYARTIMQVANFVFIGFITVLLVAVILIVRSYARLRVVNRQLLVARMEAEDLSLKDALTGLLNRRAFLPLVEYELQRRGRFGSVASLMVADIDHFKRVNDTYGHDVGDIVLKEVAKAMRETIRGTDTLARWGGEEFIVLLPDTDEDNGFVLAEKIRRVVMDIRFDPCPPVTISIGIARNDADESFLDWFKKTDGALYRAKETGRNRTVAASGAQYDAHAGSPEMELLMLQIPWRDEYRVGVAAYDEQHRALFTLANGLVNAIVNAGSREEILSLLGALHDECSSHFKDEEGYLKSRKSTYLEHHANEHALLLGKLESQIEAYERGDVPAYALLSFICGDMIVRHILGEDKTSFQEIT